ncbi:uncharacterized protein LOC127057557 isoform X2 [Gopherus flavomarginatus]|uniref:uncharacterized protein LOC127057557 isoform X2 n=1 Tax=Gopherus flavomarginatus TaxID=286002 RepID=UPI0021CC03F2|nr:uncharacterized protein LOC127057557 isoform X2 [Gopherus flavomarginatus]XP_050822332.1 uncharacterized protein LOC127057557 isoform X2 [Gopherus flavomarginatus]
MAVGWFCNWQGAHETVANPTLLTFNKIRMANYSTHSEPSGISPERWGEVLPSTTASVPHSGGTAGQGRLSLMLSHPHTASPPLPQAPGREEDARGVAIVWRAKEILCCSKLFSSSWKAAANESSMRLSSLCWWPQQQPRMTQGWHGDPFALPPWAVYFLLCLLEKEFPHLPLHKSRMWLWLIPFYCVKAPWSRKSQETLQTRITMNGGSWVGEERGGSCVYERPKEFLYCLQQQLM